MNKIAVLGLASLFLLADCAASMGTSENATSLNGFRAAHGRGPLRSNATLVSLARAHAEDMARRGSLDHDGFMQYRGPAGARAENVAYGCADAACTIQQWVNSSGHRENMLLPDIKSYGLASAVSPSGRRYWALELGH
jgi:uncharacterized protein YkwD